MNATSRAMKESAEEVEEFVSNCPFFDAKIDEMYIYKIQSLCKTLKRENTMYPFNFFPINNGAFMSFLATSMTYIVVMIQFKTTELPLKA